MRKYLPARTLLMEPSLSAAPASFAAPANDHPNTLFDVVSHDGGSNSSSSPPSYQFDGSFSPSMAIIMVVLLTSFFFMGFFSVYLKKCTSDRESSINNAAAARRRESTPVEQGLDPAVVESLPMVIYSAVKKTREGKAITECPVCLTEFEDNQPLRLLPKCKHCFHPECIDMWLYTHTTCPLCRRSLLLESGLGSFRWGWGSFRGSRRLSRSEDIHGGEPMDLALTEGGGIARIDEAGTLSPPAEVVSSVRSWRRGPDLKLDREPCKTDDSSIVSSLRPSASVSSSHKEGTSSRSELKRSNSTGHFRVKRASSRASLLPPGSSSTDHPNDGQPLSSCLPLGASTSARMHRSSSHAMLSSSKDDNMQSEESGVLAGIQDSSSSKRWNRSFSFKRAFSLRRGSQEAMANSMGAELASSSGAHRTFDKLVV